MARASACRAHSRHTRHPAAPAFTARLPAYVLPTQACRRPPPLRPHLHFSDLHIALPPYLPSPPPHYGSTLHFSCPTLRLKPSLLTSHPPPPLHASTSLNFSFLALHPPTLHLTVPSPLQLITIRNSHTRLFVPHSVPDSVPPPHRYA